MCPICYNPIGIIHSSFKEVKGMPIQPSATNSRSGFIEIFDDYANGLQDIEGFSHLMLIYHFHRIRESKLTVIPFMDDKEHGIFATRSPVRPNAIGISIIKLIERTGNQLYVDHLDILDKTPLIDIKPFFEQYDNRFYTRSGWLNNSRTVDNTIADDRFEACSL